MRFGILLIGGILVLGSVGVGRATVNCKQVRKYLETGRTARQVAETMIVSEDDVKECQEEGKAEGDDKGAEAKSD